MPGERSSCSTPVAFAYQQDGRLLGAASAPPHIDGNVRAKRSAGSRRAACWSRSQDGTPFHHHGVNRGSLDALRY
jgi:hypothetical protein